MTFIDNVVRCVDTSVTSVYLVALNVVSVALTYSVVPTLFVVTSTVDLDSFVPCDETVVPSVAELVVLLDTTLTVVPSVTAFDSVVAKNVVSSELLVVSEAVVLNVPGSIVMEVDVLKVVPCDPELGSNVSEVDTTVVFDTVVTSDVLSPVVRSETVDVVSADTVKPSEFVLSSE